MRHIEIYSDIKHRWVDAPGMFEMDPDTVNELDKMVDIFEEDPAHALYRTIDGVDFRVYDIPEVIREEDHDCFNRYYNDPEPTTQELIETEYLAADLREISFKDFNSCIYYLAGRAPSLPISEAVSLVEEIVGGVR